MVEAAVAPTKTSFLPDLLAFSLGLLCAWYLDWNTTDLVWSLWLSSLVLGYLTIISIMAAGVLLATHVAKNTAIPENKSSTVKGVGIGVGLFLFVFFTFHFCGFHAGHAVFLNTFFPLEGIEKNTFDAAFMNPFLLWYTVITKIMPLFGLFLIPVAIAERHALLRPYYRARAYVQKQTETVDGGPMNLMLPAMSNKNNPLKEAIAGPYINVIRMHILIFVFAGISAIGLDSFAVFALVYAVYFFPWRRLGLFKKA